MDFGNVKRKRYVFVHPKLRHYVAANFPGAVRVEVRQPKTVKQTVRRFRDSRGRFTSPQKAIRSLAAKKAAETRKLKKAGAVLQPPYVAEQSGQPRRMYEVRKLTPDILQAMIQREIPEGNRPTFYVRVHYRDSDGNEHFRQTGWFRATKSNAEAATEAVEELYAEYEMEEILNIEVVYGFALQVAKT